MRKLKGVIGAIVVVIALMGSVLAGFALNVNGSTEIVNAYEKVTDVSGLYSHSQEKTFIEYNPASNYIGYSGEKIIAYENPIPTGGYGLKNITSGTIIIDPTNRTINVNGDLYNGLPTEYLNTPFVHDYGILEGSGPVNYFATDGILTGIISPITITINNDTTVIEVNGQAHTFTGNTHNLVYWTGSDYDYIEMKGIRGGNAAAVPAYIDDLNNVLSAGNDGEEYQSHGTTANYRGTGTQGTIPLEKTGTQINGPVYQMNVNYDLQNDGKTYQAYGVYYPRFVYGPGLGIDYTESSRVNNYPIDKEYSQTSSTTTIKLPLSKGMTTDYVGSGGAVYLGNSSGRYIIDPSENYGYDWNASIRSYDYYGYRSDYLLSDLLNTISLPDNTTQITFETGNAMGGIWSDLGGEGNADIGQLALNKTRFGGLLNGSVVINNTPLTSTQGYSGFRAIYTVATGVVEVYTGNGVKLYTGTLNDTIVETFYNSTGPASGTVSFDDGYEYNIPTWSYKNRGYDTSSYLNLTIVSNGTVENIIYMDPTKGIKLDPANIGNVTWNNEYENGNIKILFRAEETYSTYHNELTINGNTIAVDYASNKFSVSLNGGDPVDVGRWRNIVLNLDLNNGSLTAIPVRTFNSYTNVELDTTNIPIGEMENSTTTNIIQWLPTSNSFRFSVYSTDVFLNTYGAVMVNPSLDISQYFTNLNNFYRLEFRGFTVVGDSLTINGITGSTSGQNITFDNQILSLKNLDVTYADGKVNVSDGSASVDLGDIQNTTISGAGTWYFTSQLDRGFTESKQVYSWDWGDFIFNNTQFCVIFIGLIIAGLIAGRRVSSFGVVDYALMGIAIAIALTTQVIA